MHSIESYLQRCSTEKLHKIVLEYLHHKSGAVSEEIIFQILDVLWNRQERFPENIPLTLVLRWEERTFP